MTRSFQLTVLVALAAMATAFMSACTSASQQSQGAGPSAPVPAVSASNAASPSASSLAGSASARPTPILDGLLMTASGERVIDDSISDYASRGAQGWQAATRSASNPIGSYRTQLLLMGWKLTVDEPTRIAAQRKGDWISVTTTDLQSLTGSLPWGTVLAYAHLAVEATDL